MHTTDRVINRDFDKLKNSYGARWVNNYFAKVDSLFNPNKVQIVRYQYSGVVTKDEAGAYIFHAITDMCIKGVRPRVSFSRRIMEFVSWVKLADLCYDDLVIETALTSRILDRFLINGPSTKDEIVPTTWYLCKWLETKAEFLVTDDSSININSWKNKKN